MGWVIGAGFAGLLLGSFANVVAHRVPRAESIVRPASRCPSCRTPLAARDNVPVLSWLLLRGRCRHCGAPIAVRYPLLEVVMAVAFALTAVRLPERTDLIAYLPFVWALITLSAIDLEHKILPNRIVYPSVVVMAALLAVSGLLGPGSDAWVRAILAGAASSAIFLVLLLIYPAGMGLGDVKLAALLGMALGYLGWGHVFVGLFLGFATGAVGGLMLIAARRAGLKSEVPFGPYLALGTLAAVLYGRPIVDAWLGA